MNNNLITLDRNKVLQELKRLEELRDEYPFTSAEYIELDEQIKLVESIIKKSLLK